MLIIFTIAFSLAGIGLLILVATQVRKPKYPITVNLIMLFLGLTCLYFALGIARAAMLT